MGKEIIIASTNYGKIKEFDNYFKNFNIKILSQEKFNIPESKEPHYTFIENALEKARNVYANINTTIPVLADDSGICCEALNGLPGVLSARYSGENKSSIQNNKKLNLELQKHSNKKVYYICILVILRHLKDPDPIISYGKLNGLWADNSIGENGFGYDSHFFIPEYNKTLGQLDINIKNKISHRAIALKKIINSI